MTGFLGNLKTPAYALFRIVFAFLYWCHGLVWLFNAFGGRPVPEMPPMLWTAGVLETVLQAS